MTKDCLICGKEFKTKPSYVRNGGGKYCSHVCYSSSLIGKMTWSRGKTFSTEYRKMLSESHRGKIHSGSFKRGHGGLRTEESYMNPIYRTKLSKPKPSMRGRFVGENGPGWRGGISSENRKIRGSAEYFDWRKSVFERDDYTCQFCGIKGGKLEADHILPFSVFQELRLDITNGRTLCELCHRTTPTWGYNAVKIYDYC